MGSDEGTDPGIVWDRLGRVDGKRRLYEQDVYFREGFADLIEAAGPGAAEVLHDLALLVIKPDGLVAGKAGIILDFVFGHRFELVAWEEVTFARHVWRELWRYQLNAATLDRLAVNEIVLDGTGFLLLLRTTGDTLPASVRLSALKGSSDTSRQPEDCLRRRLAQPNRVLSLLHVADEPADVLRELALLVRPTRQREIWRAAVDGGRSDPAGLRDRIEASGADARPVDTGAALHRVEAVVLRCAPEGPDRALALEAIARMRAGSRISWRRFRGALERAGVECDRWDLAVLGSTFIHYDRPGIEKLIGPGSSSLWLGAEPRSVEPARGGA